MMELGKHFPGFNAIQEEFVRLISESVVSMLSSKKRSSSEPKREYLTRKEVQGILKVHRSTLDRWARDGILVPSKVGGILRYCRSDVDKAIESLKKTGFSKRNER